MALKLPPTVGKLLYGALFVVVLPAALAGWAYGARVNVSLPGVQSTPWGTGIGIAGALLWLGGVVSLWVRGDGLPMNAFPPQRLVTQGLYAVLAHPLYVGATALSAGASLVSGSAAGLWLVTPMLALSAAALWWGYERMDLTTRLGAPHRAAWLGVPLISTTPPRVVERLGALVVSVAAPALVAVALHSIGLDGRPSSLEGSRFPVLMTLGLLVAGVAVPRTVTGLRDVVLSSWLGSLFLALFDLALPSGPFGGRLPLAPDGALLALMAMTGSAAMLHGVSFAALGRWALALGAGTLVVGAGMEAALGAVCFTLAMSRWRWWRGLLWCCERVANCWRESDFGAVRIIHIGWFAAVPAFGGAAHAVVLLGPSSVPVTLGLFVAMIIGAALWAQIIEGSPALSRPYGFFGAVAGVIVYALVQPALFDTSPWLVLGGFSAVVPWGQGFARLRCFANGCCHGSPCAPELGVVYRNPRTRVVRLAQLGGVPIHPAQLYSLIGNLIIGIVEMRLWAEGASLALITGVYFALMGLARFVEEAWRGEPQTPKFGGLRLYQWIAAGCLVLGAVLTVIPGTPHAPQPVLSLEALWAGLGAGGLTWLVSSIDFPKSTRRFSRLA